MPGMPDFFISSSAMPSSLATALSTALSGNGIAGTSGGGTSDGPQGRSDVLADGCGGERRRDATGQHGHTATA